MGEGVVESVREGEGEMMVVSGQVAVDDISGNPLTGRLPAS